MLPASPNSAHWADIQGNITPGFKKDHQTFVVLSFPDARSGRLWLSLVAPDIASAGEVSAFNGLFKAIGARVPGAETRVVTARWLNVAVSWQGFLKLGALAGEDPFQPSFRLNRVPLVEAHPDFSESHGLLMLAADRPEDLQTDLDRHRELFRRTGVRELHAFNGNTLPGSQRGHEHFGFKDLISDPILAGSPEDDHTRADVVSAAEFIVGMPGGGMPGAAAALTPVNPLTYRGSYVAFVQLEQQVGAFHAAVQHEATRLGTRSEDLAAAIVGRHTDGTLLDQPSRLSHIRRARPDWLPPTEVSRHRLLRRGIPYGPTLTTGSADDGQQRGLLFLTYQADLSRQFEHVWQQWLNGTDFPSPAAGRDGLVGQPNGPLQVRYGTAGLARSATIALARAQSPTQTTTRVNLPSFVTPRYAGYFFAPARSTVARLGAGTPLASAARA